MAQTKDVILDTIEVKGHTFSVQIFIEKRSSSRVSFTKKGILMRISHFLPKAEKEKQILTFKNWAIEHIEKNPEILTTKEALNYKDGDRVTLMDVEFTIQIRPTNAQDPVGSVQIASQTITLSMPAHMSDAMQQKSARWLVMQLSKKACLPALTARIHSWNDQYFKKKITKINIRDKSTSWGSCSKDGSINMSVHLLKAPIDIIDYVIVHELAHLIEFNHSPAFWKVVENMMSDYEEKEKRLNKNKYLYRF